MIMKRVRLFFLLPILFLSLNTFGNYQYVVMETSLGTMKLKLYEDTPLHSENFIKLVKEGFYNELLFHRVIKSFMIQTGDPNSKNASSGTRLGSGGPGYTIPSEFRAQHYHKKGALSAARLPDNINPNKESSGSQFYIVQGNVLTEDHLNAFEMRGMHIKFTPEQISDYTTIGGTPHLDYEYTVFGEVVEGLEIIDKIASVPTDQADRPFDDVRILKIYTTEK